MYFKFVVDIHNIYFKSVDTVNITELEITGLESDFFLNILNSVRTIFLS